MRRPGRRAQTSPHDAEPLRDDFTPAGRPIAVRMVAATLNLPECPGWMCSGRGTSKGDRNDMILITVDDEHRTCHSRRKTVEGGRSEAEAGNRGYLPETAPRRIWPSPSVREVPGVQHPVTSVVEHGSGERAAAASRREEAAGEHDCLDRIRQGSCDSKRIHAALRVADEDQRPAPRHRTGHTPERAQTRDDPIPLARRSAHAADADDRTVRLRSARQRGQAYSGTGSARPRRRAGRCAARGRRTSAPHREPGSVPGSNTAVGANSARSARRAVTVLRQARGRRGTQVARGPAMGLISPVRRRGSTR
jgi:hypothetical protein